MFNVIIIDPRNPVVPPSTLGIEVTDPKIASRCDLGNIDEQHGHAAAGRAACLVALTWPLPEPGTSLGMLIPDLDSLCACAVLSLRAEGADLSGAEVAARLAAVAAGDAFEGGHGLDRAETRAIHTLAASRDVPLATRLGEVARWVLTGEEGPETVAALARAEARAVARAAELQMATVEDGIAVLRHADIAGVSDLYALSPRTPAVSIAVYPAYRWAGGGTSVKITIGWQSPPGVDVVQRVLDALNRAEGDAGDGVWGGNLKSGIIGSPQGRSPRVHADRAIEIVRGAL